MYLLSCIILETAQHCSNICLLPSLVSTNNPDDDLQEEYVEGEDIGTLECGHDFHTACIKQWLMQKNLCPICKTTGLASRE